MYFIYIYIHPGPAQIISKLKNKKLYLLVPKYGNRDKVTGSCL